MSKPARYGMFAALAAALAAGAWLALDRANPPLPPPALSADAEVDPQIAEAISTALNAARASPRDAQVRANLAMIYHANGLHSLAATTYEQALALDRRHPKWWYWLAQVRALQNDLEAALQMSDRAIALDNRVPHVHWRRGFWQLDQARYDDAETSFRRALELNADDVAARVGLARVHLHRQQYAEAAALLRPMVQAGGAAPPPNLPYLRQLLGMAELHLGGGAAPAAHNLTQTRGDPIHWGDDWDREIRRLRVGYRAALDELDRLVLNGQPALAITKANALLRTRPNDVGASNYLALGHFGLEQFDQGIAILNASLNHEPDHFATHLNLVRGYQAKGDFNRALAHARRAVEINPGLGFAHLAHARVLLAMNRPHDAIEPLTRAVRTGMNDPQVRVLLGDALLHVQRWSEAARVFEQTIGAAPETAAAYAGLAHARAELGDLETARAAIQHARQLDANLPTLPAIAARVAELERRAGGAR